MKMLVRTWKEMEDRLDSFRVGRSAKEQVRRLTAPIREQERREAARFVAYEYAEACCPAGAPARWPELAAWALLEAESGGLYGGGYIAPGAGTTRHPAFRRLGKGRRPGRDGGAWTAAIRDAADRMGSALNAHIVPAEDPVRAVAICDGDDEGRLPAEVDLSMLLSPAELAVYASRRIIEAYGRREFNAVAGWARILEKTQSADEDAYKRPQIEDPSHTASLYPLTG